MFLNLNKVLIKMILLKFLGTMDFLAAISLILSALRICPFRVAFAFVLYLFFKGIVFKDDPASMIDMGIAVLLLIVYFIGPWGIFGALTFGGVFYLLQKTLMSWTTI